MKLFLFAGGLFLILLPDFLLKSKLSLYQVDKEGTLVQLQIIKLPYSCVGTKVDHYAHFKYQNKTSSRK